MTPPDRKTSGQHRWRARAFGLDIDAAIDAPGLAPASSAPTGRPTRLDLTPVGEIDRDWPSTGGHRILEERFEGDTAAEPARTIDFHEDHGYRLFARHFGIARIAGDGSRVCCAPPDDELWSWQRFLVGRVLPWTAVLRGYEAFHASAVALRGGAVAFVGPTGWGKTSLALRLVLGGAGFITDDVLVVEIDRGSLRVHPGASVASVRPAERAAVSDTALGQIGTMLGESGKTYLQLDPIKAPLPLIAVYFLTADKGPAIEPTSPDPRLLLASTFVLGLQSSQRLRNQLDVCAAIAQTVPSFKLRNLPGEDAGTAAQRVTEHIGATEAAT